MKKQLALCVTIVCMMMSGCATFQNSDGYLLKSMNVGVLEGTRLLDWSAHIYNGDGVAFNVLYADEKNLMQSFRDGNIDILVGLPLTDEGAADKIWATDPIAMRQFDFFVRSDDPNKLHEYLLFKRFMSKVKKIGYASQGESGVVNRLVLKEKNVLEKFVACGTLKECMFMLDEKKIDSLFADELLLKKHQQNKQLQSPVLLTAGFGYEQPFSLLINQRTLSEKDFNRLSRIVH